MTDINRYDCPPSVGMNPYKKGRFVYFEAHATEVRELLRDVSMWRGRAMELLGDFARVTGANPQSVLDKWDWHERNRKRVGKEKEGER